MLKASDGMYKYLKLLQTFNNLNKNKMLSLFLFSVSFLIVLISTLLGNMKKLCK